MCRSEVATAAESYRWAAGFVSLQPNRVAARTRTRSNLTGGSGGGRLRDEVHLTPCTPDVRRFHGMDSVAAKLERLKREVRKEWKAKWRNKLRQAAPANAAEWRALAAEAAGAALKVVLIIALPFAVLVRGSVFIYEHGTRSVWLAVATAGILSGGVVTAYAVWIARRFTRRGGRGGRGLVMPLAKWVALPLVVFYCGYSLLYLASVNAKSDPV